MAAEQTRLAPSPTEAAGEYRRLLFAIAYRMLGSVADAEDVVQDAYLRWQDAPRDDIESPKAFLSTVVTRLCIDHLRSARVRREEYVGMWLPEPLVGAVEPDVADVAALNESLSTAFLLLLERLSPLERAIFLLHDVFAYEYVEIAPIVGKSVDYCRQLVKRARGHLTAERPRFDPLSAQRDQLVRQFVRACQTGDLDGLVSTLAEDVTAWGDGGGKVPAARHPIHGVDAVARFLIGLVRKAPPDFTVEQETINGQPGAIVRVGGVPVAALTLDVLEGQIVAIRSVANPDKLRVLSNGRG